MYAVPVEQTLADQGEAEQRQRRRRPTQLREWRIGGTTVRRWSWPLVGVGITGLGVAVLAPIAIETFIGGALGKTVALIGMWIALLVPAIVAFRISLPRGLFRFRPQDLLFGVVTAIALWLLAGVFAQAATGAATWPSVITANGSLPASFWLDSVLAPVVVSPVIEELFFHAFLLVLLFTAFRRLTDQRIVAAIGALLVTTGLFLLLHQLTGSLVATWNGAASVAAVGLGCGLLVMLTGRIWSAIIAHVLYNGMLVSLVLVGSIAGVGLSV